MPIETIRAHSGSVLDGWHRVLQGKAVYGDKFWDGGRGCWLPVTSPISYLGMDVTLWNVPTIIRKKEKS